MADYYPLLSRAVGGLPNSSEDARQAIYGRARKALLGQLQAIQPPVPQADIDREAQALDQAIARIEAELAVAAALGGDEAAASPAPVPQAVPAAPAPPVPPLPVPPKPPVQPPVQPPALPPSPPVPPPGPPPMRSPAPAVRPSIPASAPVAAPPAGPAIQPPSAAAPGLPTAAAFDVKAGDAGAAVSPVVMPRKPDDAPPLRRPSAAGKPAAKDRTGLYAMLIALALGAAAIAGYFAWQWRVTPAQLSQPRPAAGASQPQAQPPANTAGQTSEPAPAQRDQRIVQRVPTGDAPPSEPVATPPQEPATAQPAQQEPAAEAPAQQTPAAPAQQAQAPQTPAAEANPGVPVAQRSAILIAAPTKENPNGVDTRIGTVVWRTDNVNRGANQPLSLAIRGDVDIAPAGLKVIITIEKNLDSTLSASHMITVRFQREANSAIGEIADIDNLQMRDQQSPQVEPLEAERVKITANIFIVALVKSDTVTKRNVDTMLARGWLDLPIRMADGKLAKLTMEKGGPGDKIFKDVFARWEK